MNGHAILETKTSTLLGTLLLSFSMIFFIVSGYLISDSVVPSYPQLPGVIIGGFFGLFGFLCLYALRRIRKYKLYEDRLDVHTFMGFKVSSLSLSDIIRIEEHAKNTRYVYSARLFTNHTSLNIILREDTIDLIDDTTYQTLKYEILRRTAQTINVKVMDINSKRFGIKMKKDTIPAIIMLAFGLLFLKTGISSYLHPDRDIRNQQFSKVRATAASIPEISRGKSASVHILLREFPEFKFLIYYGYGATDKDYLVENVKPGDSLFLFVETKDYEKKLVKEKPLTFSDKTVNYSFVEVYGLSDKKQEYLSLNGYYAASIADNKVGIWIALFGLAMIIWPIFSLKKMYIDSASVSDNA